MKKILVTAGGTTEPIDAVRSITNESSGRLGAKIADAFVQLGFEVVYLHTEKSLMPKQKVQSITIKTVKDVEISVNTLMKNHQFYAIIHAMAISDFTVKNVLDYETIRKSDHIEDLNSIIKRDQKISSNKPIFLQLNPAPKIINLFKKLQPDTILVGFKLLANSDEKKLIQAAQKQITENNSDYVLCNHKEQVHEEAHKAFLYSEDGIIARFDNKTDIANGLAQLIQKEISNEK